MSESNALEERFQAARKEGHRRILEASDLAELEEARVRVLGRKAPLSEARQGLRDLPPEEKRRMGKVAVETRAELEQVLEERLEKLRAAELALRWEREALDVSLPGTPLPQGSLHLLTQTLWEIIDIFTGLGYRMVEGPEVEYARYNFDALNTPAEHPSRSPQDTFFIAGTDEQVCLRTQTSPMQIRVMERQEPPVYVVVPGRTYRRDAVDATHLAQFFQMEGLAVDEGLTMADLKGTLQVFAREIFGQNLDVRLRPHFFPFTEPSAEMDVQCFSCGGSGCRVCKGEGWIEILGCGMVDPAVLSGAGYDPERYTGFAFGMGIERIAALAHGVTDIRQFYENDLRFASQFGVLR
jgi:phenylalanyl-tRNA synthetase alpha chain